MKKIFSNLILSIFILLISLGIILSTIGIETEKFNNIISKKISQINNDINLKLTTVKFKLDIKEISLFLETIEPEIIYRDTPIPTKNIKVYIDFVSLIKSEPKIKNINFVLNELDIKKLKKLTITFKPSNLTSYINNKIKQGKLNAEIEIYLDANNLLENFIAKGSVNNFKAKIYDNINLNKTNFTFFADKTDILIKNTFGEIGPIKIIDGDLKLNLSSEISIESHFKSNIKYSSKLINLKNLIKDFKNAGDIVSLEAILDNSFLIDFDKTYKVKKYNFQSKGSIINAELDFKKPLKNYFSSEKINHLSIENSKINIDFKPKKINTFIAGKYSLNKDIPLAFNLENFVNGELLNFKLDAEYHKPINLELINYKKPKNLIANLSLILDKKKDNIKIKKISLNEGNNSISVEDIKLIKEKIISLKKASVKTNKNGKKNNDFSVSFGRKILIEGSQFDGTNLPKILNKKKITTKNKISEINNDIEINLTNVIAPLSENLKNFKLIGKIEKGQFTKISSKGDFGKNNFLDIMMKKDENSQKKYFEVYSDLTKPLLTEYSFFKGLVGGKLLFSSIIDGDTSNSKLIIEDFSLINAPGMIKLLSLADLSGLADLAEGEGLSFDTLEINIEKNKDNLKINEIIALGSSISVLMDGYQDSSVTSLRGTLIPAKTVNKIISKIPVLGKIIIPKEIGEGLFGISFKMKGPEGKIKTTINPIRTITPRFIQKIIDRNKKSR